MAPKSQHFRKIWMTRKWILACGDQPTLLLHSSRSSSHWMQMTLEGKLTLNAPRMESSKNWMLCWVSALHSFLHRKHKQEVKPSPERSATHQSHQELGDLLFFFYCLSGFETSCSSCSTSHHGLALHSQCFLGVGILGRQLGLYT